jgi:hypothetical protein
MIKFRLFKSRKIKEENVEQPEQPTEAAMVDKAKELAPTEVTVEKSFEEKPLTPTPVDYYETLVSSDAEEATVLETPKSETKEWVRRTWEDVSEIEKKIDKMEIKAISKKGTNVDKKVENLISKLEKNK